MIIYCETRRQFLEDVDQNALQPKLCEAFRARTGGVPSDRTVWADEYARLSLALRRAKLADDTQVAIEYHVSAAGRFRIDALLAGSDGSTDHAVILELKAWSTAETTEIPGLVWAPLGGGKNHQHPCHQAKRYSGMIERFNEDVRSSNIQLHAAAYLFNLHRRTPEPLEDARYQGVLQDARLFLAGDLGDLTKFLERYLRRRPSTDVVARIDSGRLVPAPALVDRVHSMLEGNEEFQLIDAQYEAFQIIEHAISKEGSTGGRQVFIVEGGPGTGKSVIAVRLLASVLARKQMGFLVAPNQAFRATLIEALSKGNKRYRDDGQALIHSSWSFHDVDYEKRRSLEVLIVDEAHRLKDQAYQYKGKSMVEDMVRAARISVFFVDETQRVAWADTGGVDRIRAAAAKFGATVEPGLQLTAQFRCSGSDGYLNWLDDVLQIRPTANFDNWADGQYEFRVFDRAKDLHDALRAKNTENRARLIAGYTWAWPTKRRGRKDGATHVVADDLRLPWNYDDANWATTEDGIEQVGCVHTCQGVEFDWIGVLVGDDLRYAGDRVVGDPAARAATDASLKGWKSALTAAKGDPARTKAVHDRVQQLMKNTYKVLMSRGRRGCYVWCADPALRDYLRARVARAQGARFQGAPTLPPGWLKSAPAGKVPADLVPVGLPRALHGAADPDRGWIERPTDLAPEPGLFAAYVAEAEQGLNVKAGAWVILREFARAGLADGPGLLATPLPEMPGQPGAVRLRCMPAAGVAAPSGGVLAQLVRRIGP